MFQVGRMACELWSMACAHRPGGNRTLLQERGKGVDLVRNWLSIDLTAVVSIDVWYSEDASIQVSR